ncbi:MAG: cation-translocating P-type ATPase [Promethearchaeota archaeon]|nr:MAG: cation-translocating P-type ATPase [Candidatus Lokiarchaeota archaeon]
MEDDYSLVASDGVNIGDVIGIKLGMKVPLDGTIVKGQTYLDESAITGESLPIYKREGEQVFAGSVNSDSFIDVKVTKKSSETVVAQIAETIVNAQQNKSQKERFIEKFARYYTPSILIVALLIMVLPTLLFSQNFIDWFYRGLILLVISCPCALTLSTPLANIMALTKMAREGILVKGNKFVEQINNIDMIALDKTGTLTEGNLQVYNVHSYGIEKNELLKIAGSLEMLSEHPIGKSIMDYARKLNISFYDVNKFMIEKGKGIKGEIKGETYFIGNERYLNENHIDIPSKELSSIEKQGVLPVLIANSTHFLGFITIRDAIRLTSPILINGLKNRGYKTILISGDKQLTCDTIGECLNIDQIEGDLLPTQKLEKIKKLKCKNEGILMIGDGINDAPALALADLSIAVGASATDLTLETADVVIINDDLTNILTFIDIAKKTNKKIKQNIWISILVKLSFAILTVLGFMTLWLAVGIGDMGVSLFVLLNGMLIYRYKSKFQDLTVELKEREGSFLICENCKKKNLIPQHHGRDMIKVGDKLICWKKLASNENIEACNKQIPLYCPNCESELILE